MTNRWTAEHFSRHTGRNDEPFPAFCPSRHGHHQHSGVAAVPRTHVHSPDLGPGRSQTSGAESAIFGRCRQPPPVAGTARVARQSHRLRLQRAAVPALVEGPRPAEGVTGITSNSTADISPSRRIFVHFSPRFGQQHLGQQICATQRDTSARGLSDQRPGHVPAVQHVQ